MAKRQFRIGDLAKELKVKKFVIRFWEKEFNLKSGRSQGGQRFYTNDDLTIFLTIKDLLYNQGFTIVGAKKQLPEVLAGAKLASDDSFQGLDELDFSLQAAQVDEDQCSSQLDDEHDDELEDESFACAQNLAQVVDIQTEQEVICVEQVCEQPESLALDHVQPDQEVAVQTESEQHMKPESTVEETASVQAEQEVCFPTQTSLSEDLFYDGLAALKEQLLRLYELLD